MEVSKAGEFWDPGAFKSSSTTAHKRFGSYPNIHAEGLPFIPGMICASGSHCGECAGLGWQSKQKLMNQAFGLQPE